ncbi:MAG: putative quinol monooxygenase [Clostridia bacterium]
MEILLVHYTVPAEEMDGVLADFREMCDEVAENEPGCLVYRLHRDREHPGELWLYEAYDSPQSFDAHMVTPHFRRLVEDRIRPKVVARERWLLAPVEEARR